MAPADSTTQASKAEGTWRGLPRSCSKGTERNTSGVAP